MMWTRISIASRNLAMMVGPVALLQSMTTDRFDQDLD